MNIYKRLPLEVFKNGIDVKDILIQEEMEILNELNKGAIQLDIMFHSPKSNNGLPMGMVREINNLFIKKDEKIVKQNIYYGGTMGSIDVRICEFKQYKPFGNERMSHLIIPRKPLSGQSTKVNVETKKKSKALGKIIQGELPPPYEVFIEYWFNEVQDNNAYIKKPDIDRCVNHEYTHFGLGKIGIFALHTQKICKDENEIHIWIRSLNDKVSQLRYYKSKRLYLNLCISENEARELFEEFDENQLFFNIRDYYFTND